jgi:hypothetical protein
VSGVRGVGDRADDGDGTYQGAIHISSRGEKSCLSETLPKSVGEPDVGVGGAAHPRDQLELVPNRPQDEEVEVVSEVSDIHEPRRFLLTHVQTKTANTGAEASSLT